jgi:uncharacterized protein (TIGR04255 family)
LSQIRPLFEAHSIDQVAFAIDLKSELTPEVISVLQSHAAKVKDLLPKVNIVGKVQIHFDADKPNETQVNHTTQPGAISLESFQPNGRLAWKFEAIENKIVVSCNTYSRWTTVWPLACRILVTFMAPIINVVLFTRIALEYLDGFFIVEDAADFRAGNLLREGSKYLPPHIFEAPDLWHAHTGAYEYLPDKSRRLIRVNTDCINLKRPNTKRVNIVTLIQEGWPGTGEFDASSEEAIRTSLETCLTKSFGELHDASKVILRHVVNDAISKRISLDAP